MLKASVQFINDQLENTGYFEKSFEVCEVITRKEQRFPAEYKSKGEYTEVNNFDKYNGVSYLRKRGGVTVADAVDTLKACGDLVDVSLPLRLVAVVPRKKLNCDDKYSEDVIASTIMRELITHGPALKGALSARSSRISIDGYNTDGPSVLTEEYSGLTIQDISYNFAYLAIDLTVRATMKKECLTRDCETAYS